MTGLFEDIRGFFKAEFSGRYLAFLLRELGRREPEAFAKIFDISSPLAKSLLKGELEITNEWSFPGKDADRRADLVVLEAGKPRLLVEIKEDDSRSPRNSEQLDDYLDYLSSLSAPKDGMQHHRFVVLSRYALLIEQDKKLKDAAKNGAPVIHKRYRDLYESLTKCKGEFSRMLKEYLEDIGVKSYRTIDFKKGSESKSLMFLLVNMLGLGHKHGLGRLHSDESVATLPRLFDIFLGNLEVIAERVQYRNPALISRKFYRGFAVRPQHDLKRLKKNLDKKQDLDDHDELPEKPKSGSVLFYTTGTINDPKGRKTTLKKTWIGVEIGYGLDMPRQDNGLGAGIYLWSMFYFPGHKNEAYAETEYLNEFPNEDAAEKKLKQCLSKALKKALKLAPKPCQNVFDQFKV